MVVWLGRLAFVIFMLWVIGPIGIGIVWHVASKAWFWAFVGGTFASFMCGTFVAGALLAPDELWWRRVAFGLSALAGVVALTAWMPVMLYMAAFGAVTGVGVVAWERFKGPIPDGAKPAGGHPPAF